MKDSKILMLAVLAVAVAAFAVISAEDASADDTVITGDIDEVRVLDDSGVTYVLKGEVNFAPGAYLELGADVRLNIDADDIHITTSEGVTAPQSIIVTDGTGEASVYLVGTLIGETLIVQSYAIDIGFCGDISSSFTGTSVLNSKMEVITNDSIIRMSGMDCAFRGFTVELVTDIDILGQQFSGDLQVGGGMDIRTSSPSDTLVLSVTTDMHAALAPDLVTGEIKFRIDRCTVDLTGNGKATFFGMIELVMDDLIISDSMSGYIGLDLSTFEVSGKITGTSSASGRAVMYFNGQEAIVFAPALSSSYSLEPVKDEIVLNATVKGDLELFKDDSNSLINVIVRGADSSVKISMKASDIMDMGTGASIMDMLALDMNIEETGSASTVYYKTIGYDGSGETAVRIDGYSGTVKLVKTGAAISADVDASFDADISTDTTILLNNSVVSVDGAKVKFRSSDISSFIAGGGIYSLLDSTIDITADTVVQKEDRSVYTFKGVTVTYSDMTPTFRVKEVTMAARDVPMTGISSIDVFLKDYEISLAAPEAIRDYTVTVVMNDGSKAILTFTGTDADPLMMVKSSLRDMDYTKGSLNISATGRPVLNDITVGSEASLTVDNSRGTPVFGYVCIEKGASVSGTIQFTGGLAIGDSVDLDNYSPVRVLADLGSSKITVSLYSYQSAFVNMPKDYTVSADGKTAVYKGDLMAEIALSGDNVRYGINVTLEGEPVEVIGYGAGFADIQVGDACVFVKAADGKVYAVHSGQISYPLTEGMGDTIALSIAAGALDFDEVVFVGQTEYIMDGKLAIDMGDTAVEGETATVSDESTGLIFTVSNNTGVLYIMTEKLGEGRYDISCNGEYSGMLVMMPIEPGKAIYHKVGAGLNDERVTYNTVKVGDITYGQFTPTSFSEYYVADAPEGIIDSGASSTSSPLIKRKLN